MAKSENDEIEMLSSNGPCNEPVTLWFTRRHKRIYEWLRDEAKVSSATETKRAAIEHLEYLAKRFGFPEDQAS